MSTNWWKQTTQLRDIKDPTILKHQYAKQQIVFVLSNAIKKSILPDVIAQIILNFIYTKQLYNNANNNRLLFKLQTVSLSPLTQISNKNLHSSSLKNISWKANYKYCVGMEFKLKNDIKICGIELDLFFGGIQCYAVLSQYKKTKNKSIHNNKKLYKNTCSFKLIPCDIRQKIDRETHQTFHKKLQNFYSSTYANYDKYKRQREKLKKTSQMIFTEINTLNNGGLKLEAKNAIYKLGFVISDGFYCNDYVNLKGLNKNNVTINKNIKCVHYRLLNKSKLLGDGATYFGEGLIEDDGTSNALKWFPKMRFLTF